MPSKMLSDIKRAGERTKKDFRLLREDIARLFGICGILGYIMDIFSKPTSVLGFLRLVFAPLLALTAILFGMLLISMSFIFFVFAGFPLHLAEVQNGQ